jgi:integrase
MTDLIAEYARHLRSAGKAPRTTIRSRVQLLERLDRELPMGLELATIAELENWLAGPDDPGLEWSANTRASYWQHCTQFYRWAADPKQPRLDFDPSASLPRPRRPKGVPHPIRDEDLARLLTVAREPFKTYIKLAAFQGMRSGEISRLCRDHVDERETRIAGKGDKVRVVPTHEQVWPMVKDLPAGPVARTIRGNPASPQYISGETGKYLRALQIEGTLHWGRHWFATKLLLEEEEGGAGANLRTVQELLGHEDVSTTAIYTRVTSAQRRNAVAALRAPAPASA